MSSLLSLNYDVLSLIVDHLPASDASHLALASRESYSLAMPRSISSVTLGGLFYKSSSSPTSQIQKFASFFLANPTRALSLRRLEIMRDSVRVRDPAGGGWVVDPNCVATLASVLALCKNLQELTLWGSDALFAAHPPLADVLASLPILHTVTLGGDVPPLPTLARALPQVRNLTFVDGGGACGPDWDSHGSVKDGEWARLDSVDAGHPILPLARPVRKVDLRNSLYADEYVLGNALAFLAQTQPVVFSCALDRSVREEDFVAKMAEAAPGIKALQVILERCDSLSEILSWMSHVARTLTALPLKGLSLCRAGYIAPDDDLPLTLPINKTSSPLPTLAHAIASAHPTLRWVGLQPYGQKSYNQYEQVWFEVDRVAGKVKDVRPLNAEEGKKVERVLSKLDVYE